MKIVFVFAHPDDESFSSGGTIAKLNQEGSEIKLIVATRGEEGQVGEPPVTTKEKLGEVREKELKAAAKILGISYIYFLDYRDGTLKNITSKELVKKVFSILKQELPDIVVTFEKQGISRHPDHMKISKVATIAFKKYMKISRKNIKLYHTAIPASFIKKLEKKGILYDTFGKMKGTIESEITTIVDISKTMDKKIRAMQAHKTQHSDWERFLRAKDEREFKFEYFKLILENNIV